VAARDDDEFGFLAANDHQRRERELRRVEQTLFVGNVTPLGWSEISDDAGSREMRQQLAELAIELSHDVVPR
jgi:hypothetical protein